MVKSLNSVNGMRLVLAAMAATMLLSLVFAQSELLSSGGLDAFSFADLQRNFGMGKWSSYATSHLVVYAIQGGSYAAFAAIIGSGVGVVLAGALLAAYGYIRWWGRKQIQAW